MRRWSGRRVSPLISSHPAAATCPLVLSVWFMGMCVVNDDYENGYDKDYHTDDNVVDNTDYKGKSDDNGNTHRNNSNDDGDVNHNNNNKNNNNVNFDKNIDDNGEN